MRYQVRHHSELIYAAPVTQAQFNIRLVPWQWHGHSEIAHSLQIIPGPQTRDDFDGPYCVKTTQLSFAAPLEKLSITSEFTVSVEPPFVPGSADSLADIRAAALDVRELGITSPAPYIFTSRLAGAEKDIAAWAQPLITPQKDVLGAAHAVSRAIYTEFTYQPGATNSATAPADAFAKRTGVCQDFAHIMVIALRSQGIPAAYVSGYLRTRPPPGQDRLVGVDAMHAWVNVWCGQKLGWVGFDPTNDCLANDNHIVIAMGRDYADVAPIDGTFIGSAPQTMRSSVDVMAID